MGTSQPTLRSILGILFLCLIQISAALKFDLPAVSGKNERCIRNFVFKDQLVVVTAIVSGQKGDGQKVNIHLVLPTLIGPLNSMLTLAPMLVTGLAFRTMRSSSPSRLTSAALRRWCKKSSAKWNTFVRVSKSCVTPTRAPTSV
ncbi:unnamed protein product [Aspergillus oryzae RIB40]|uniref:DNA, SC009 n=2 Tax=Aspergillus oryzae TaxID=5062 RepID=Q2UUM0_ASPOR|nr:unnamed protein product [Aspergillus oryzae RIB40]EIT79199.1 hypothetical protein Ao3042_04405 [Aspergillus oryzae 3.042]KDE83757.1 hypothetical protein AO1008_10394 [Aspergillus oryzae 100-8]BAE54745.1 unnamed protein product [Aspergillus oryzae RIB40]|eukprot:EIT79199.1 hypothetical protein Ao3042_04405 [Aspergillus oryzae 3.042]